MERKNKPDYVFEKDAFFYITEGELRLWNCKLGQQFEIDIDHVRCLMDPAFADKHPEMRQELVSTQTLVPAETTVRDWPWDILSRIFYVGTSLDMPAEEELSAEEESLGYLTYCSQIEEQFVVDSYTHTRGEGELQLPEPDLEPSMPLNEVLQRRMSSRSYSADPIELAAFSKVLKHTFGYLNHHEQAHLEFGLDPTRLRRRSSAASGSLQSCEAYVVVQHVSGVEAGIYHYRSHSHSLGLIQPLPSDFQLGQYLGGQLFANDLSFGVFLVCRLSKLAWKYKTSRILRMAFVDAGHLSQTAQLVATSLDLRTWITGVIYESQVKALLGIPVDVTDEPIFFLGFGTGAPNPIDKHLAAALRKQRAV